MTVNRRFIKLHEGSDLSQGQVSAPRSTSGYAAAYLSFSGSADLKVSIEGAIGESADAYVPAEQDWTAIQEGTIYGFHVLRTIPTLIRLRVTRGILKRAVGQFLYDIDLLPQQTEGVSISAVEGVVSSSVNSAVQSAVPMAKTIDAIGTADVYLPGDATTSSETVIPANRSLMGGGTLTTTGALSLRSRSALTGLKVVGTVPAAPVVYAAPNSSGTTLSNLDIQQSGVQSPGILLAANVDKFFASSLWVKNGEYGLSAPTNPLAMSVMGFFSDTPGVTGINIATNGAARTEGISLIGGRIRQAGLHGVQVWGGDAAVDTTLRQRGVAVLGFHVQDSAAGAGIWATNTSGGTFTGNTVDRTVLEGYDLERVNTFAIVGNSAVNVRSGAITILYGSRNVVAGSNAISLSTHMNAGNQLGNSGALAGLVIYIRDDCEHVLIANQIIDCTVKNQDGTFVTIMGAVYLFRDASPTGPKSITFVGCKFRNVATVISEYCERVDLIDCVFEYDFDFSDSLRPFSATRTDKLNLHNVTWRLLVPPYVRSGVNFTPIVITQGSVASAAGKPAVKEVRMESCRVLGWGDNSAVAILTFPGGADTSKLVLLNNAVKTFYISSTAPTRRILGNYDPETLLDSTIVNV